MEIGQRIKFPFAGGEKEGVVVKVFPKKVYLKADFDRHPGKRIVRSTAELEGKVPVRKGKEKEKKKKEKEGPEKQ
ncbi:MAG: hypothetical protein HY697_03455 [Deltaproteobacteria bacterium]|nr:hypothetical protein [Deltaproteobacteria bacterium]